MGGDGATGLGVLGQARHRPGQAAVIAEVEGVVQLAEGVQAQGGAGAGGVELNGQRGGARDARGAEGGGDGAGGGRRDGLVPLLLLPPPPPQAVRAVSSRVTSIARPVDITYLILSHERWAPSGKGGWPISQRRC
jgi:hypothetical protein